MENAGPGNEKDKRGKLSLGPTIAGSGSEGKEVAFKWATLNGERYAPGDYAQLLVDPPDEPFLVRILKIHRDVASGKTKKAPGIEEAVLMLQLFLYRPSDVEEAGGVLPADMGPKEVFLAVPLRRTENVYSDNLSAIEKKLRVLCTSPDLGNPLPSEADTSSADFLFHRAFNLNTLQFQPLKDILEEYETFFGKLPEMLDASGKVMKARDCIINNPSWLSPSPGPASPPPTVTKSRMAMRADRAGIANGTAQQSSSASGAGTEGVPVAQPPKVPAAAVGGSTREDLQGQTDSGTKPGPKKRKLDTSEPQESTNPVLLEFLKQPRLLSFDELKLGEEAREVEESLRVTFPDMEAMLLLVPEEGVQPEPPVPPLPHSPPSLSPPILPPPPLRPTPLPAPPGSFPFSSAPVAGATTSANPFPAAWSSVLQYHQQHLPPGAPFPRARFFTTQDAEAPNLVASFSVAPGPAVPGSSVAHPGETPGACKGKAGASGKASKGVPAPGATDVAQKATTSAQGSAPATGPPAQAAGAPVPPGEPARAPVARARAVTSFAAPGSAGARGPQVFKVPLPTNPLPSFAIALWHQVHVAPKVQPATAPGQNVPEPTGKEARPGKRPGPRGRARPGAGRGTGAGSGAGAGAGAGPDVGVSTGSGSGAGEGAGAGVGAGAGPDGGTVGGAGAGPSSGKGEAAAGGAGGGADEGASGAGSEQPPTKESRGDAGSSLESGPSGAGPGPSSQSKASQTGAESAEDASSVVLALSQLRNDPPATEAKVKYQYSDRPIKPHAVQVRVRSQGKDHPHFGVQHNKADNTYTAIFHKNGRDGDRVTVGNWSVEDCSSLHSIRNSRLAAKICQTLAAECLEGYLYAREVTYEGDPSEAVSSLLHSLAHLTEQQKARIREEKAKTKPEVWEALLENASGQGFQSWFLDTISAATHPDLGTPRA